VDDEQVTITDARQNLTEVVSSVRLQRRCITLTQRGKARAVVVPVELGEAVKAAGGLDAALKLLRATS
jgi:prevent-host-death family protein